jgi:hypothetical protein
MGRNGRGLRQQQQAAADTGDAGNEAEHSRNSEATTQAAQQRSTGVKLSALRETVSSRFQKDSHDTLLIVRRDRVADALGWNAEAILAVILSADSREYRAVIDVFELLGSGAVNIEVLLRLIRLTRGHARRKKDNGVRPAGSVCWWVQISSILFLNEQRANLRRLVGQGNVAVRRGTGALAWAARLIVEQNPSWAHLGTDCTAAFPSICRDVLRKAAESIVGLKGTALTHYGEVGSGAQTSGAYTLSAFRREG